MLSNISFCVLVLSLLFALSHGGVSMHNPFYCYAEDPIRPQLSMFSMENPYELVRGRNIDPNVSSCTPAKFWFLGRSGTRLPNRYEIDLMFEHIETLHRNIVSNYDAGRSSLCASDVQLIRNWSLHPNITLDKDQFLTVTGWNEVQGIAQRFQRHFPTLLPSTYSPVDYLFRSVRLVGIESSIRAFADGLFGFDGHHQVEFEVTDEPDALFHFNCPLFGEINSTSVEVDAFMDGPEYQQMHTEVSNKLGFHGSRTLTPDEIDVLLVICQFEQLYDLNSTSPLCASFSVANFQVIDYRKDLSRYYTHSYGQFPNHRRLLENLPCHLMQDMLHFLRSNDPNDERAKIFYSDGYTVLMVLNVLGAYEDRVPLTRHNFAQQTFRLFRVGRIVPKAGNLAVIRYDCAGGDHDILFLHNENPLLIEGCQPNGLCKLSMLLERLHRYLDVNCSEIFCTNS